MNIRQRRLTLIAVILLSVGTAAGLTLRGLQEDVSFYRTPTQLIAEQQHDGHWRIGGMVEQGSVTRSDDGLTIQFRMTDYTTSIPVSYRGIVPDLFREGQGVVVEGAWNGQSLTADNVLARHDEKYMPPDVARAIKK